nr:hypothetical protein [Tanacetum cinerariifolium]
MLPACLFILNHQTKPLRGFNPQTQPHPLWFNLNPNATFGGGGGDGASSEKGKTKRRGEVVETGGEKGRVVAAVVVGLKVVVARGGEWHSGSSRLGGGECFVARPEVWPEVVAGGGDWHEIGRRRREPHLLWFNLNPKAPFGGGGGDGASPKKGKTRRRGEVVETGGEKGRVVAAVVVG